MEKKNAATASDETCLVSKEELKDAQYRMVMLKGLFEAIWHLDNDGHGDALTCTIEVARKYVGDLDRDLDRMNTGALT